MTLSQQYKLHNATLHDPSTLHISQSSIIIKPTLRKYHALLVSCTALKLACI
eukprot:c37924_g1_i1 orf=147-302(-)